MNAGDRARPGASPAAPGIGPARAAHAGRIARISRDYIEYGLPWSWRPARVAARIADPDSLVVVDEKNGRLRGFAIMHIPPDAGQHADPQTEHPAAPSGSRTAATDPPDDAASRTTAPAPAMPDNRSHCAHLELLAVLPRHRRQRVGSALVAWVEESALACGKSFCVVELRESNDCAHGFYRALGYLEFEQLAGYYSGAEGALRMAHDLTPGRNRHPSPASSLMSFANLSEMLRQ